MDLRSILFRFVRDDLIITLAIFVGSFMVVSQMEKRKGWPFRLVLSYLIISAWMMTFAAMFYLGTKETFFTISVVKYAGLFVLNVAAVLLYSKADFFTALFAATVGYSLQHVCERSWELVRHNFQIPVLVDRLILLLLMASVIALYGHFAVWNANFKRYNHFERLDSRILLAIAAVVVGISIVLDLAWFNVAESTSRAANNLIEVYSSVISMLVLVVSMCHLRESDSKVRAEIADQLLHSEQARFEQDKAIHDAINIKCHDIRHQIAALGEKGYRKELKEIGSLVNIYDSAVRSENTALDVVLSNKSLACLQKGITFSCIADGRQLSFMADEDVYALFGNILDNAMDAASAIADPERRIVSLNVRVRAGCLFIEEENFYEGELRFDNGLPVTSKDDKAYHGFGMQSIRMLTDRYGGDIQLESEDGIFKLSIMLPVPGEA